MGRTYDRHQHHGKREKEPIPAGIGEQAPQFAHTRTRKRSKASVTCRTLIERIPSDATNTSLCVRQGAQTTGSDAPKITTTGTPNAAAIWAGPESLPTNSAAPAIRDLILASGAPGKVRHFRNSERSSPG